MFSFFKRVNIEEYFRKSLEIIINILIIFIIVVLIIGLFRTLYSAKELLSGDFTNGFNKIITHILSFLVIIEIFRTFIEFFKSKRFRLHSMMDPFIIFVVRELMIILYTHKSIEWIKLLGFSCLILSLGIVRTLAVIYSPDKRDKSTYGKTST